MGNRSRLQYWCITGWKRVEKRQKYEKLLTHWMWQTSEQLKLDLNLTEFSRVFDLHSIKDFILPQLSPVSRRFSIFSRIFTRVFPDLSTICPRIQNLFKVFHLISYNFSKFSRSISHHFMLHSRRIQGINETATVDL